MLDWRVTVDTARGPETVSGQCPAEGEVHLICGLPKGRLKSVRAAMALAAGETEKIFMNGYQTWTWCREMGRDERLHGLNGVSGEMVRKYGFDRYGDWLFAGYPDEPGMSHGWSWCYFRRGERFRLIASLDEQPGYTLFRYDAGKGELTIERDCAGVICGGEFHAFDLYFAEGPEDAVFDGWFAAMGLEKPHAPLLKGYSSWYNRYEDIDEASILSDLEGCKTLLEPGDLFQVDDGWEPGVGDWLEPDEKKFPGGMKALVDKIHAAGFKAGLWLAPFGARKASRFVKEHPDWLLHKDGEPWFLGSNWGGFYVLDIDKPEVLDHLRCVFHRVLHEWGFDLVKLDFLYGAAPFGTERESRAGRMIRAMDFLREQCAGKLILGCGVPVMPAFGRVDYCRVGPDVSLDWNDDDNPDMVHRERVSTRNALNNVMYRRQLNGRAYGSDPDVFFLRRENIKLTEAEKALLAKADALLGGVMLTSDDPAKYDEAQRAMYRDLLALTRAENVRVDADGRRICYDLDGAHRELALPEALF